MSARGVDNDDFVLLLPEELYSLLCNLDGVSFVLVAEEGALDLCCVLFELVEGARSESVGADQADPPALAHVVVGKLGASGSLTCSLQSDKHDHIRLSLLELVRFIFALEHLGEFLYDGLGDQFSHVGSTSFSVEGYVGFDVLAHLCYELYVHVRVKKSHRDILQNFLQQLIVNCQRFVHLLQGVLNLGSQLSQNHPF